MQTAQTMPKQQQPSALQNPTETIKGLAPIHLRTSTFTPTISPLFKRIWFVAACAICILLLLAVLLYKGRLRKFEKHPEIRILQRQKQLLASDLEKINQAQLSGDSMAFLSWCRTAIQNQLGPLWNIEPTAISLTDLRTRLQPNSALIEIVTTAEEAAYGAATLSTDTMADYYREIAKELEELL